MPGFNFGQISNIIEKTMNTDTMDIGRRMEITNQDGTIGETMPEDPIYKDVPCHIDFNKADNPDPQSIDINPIIISITLHCSIDVDLQSGDYIYAKRLNHEGALIDMYAGSIGNPIMFQSRQEAIMTVSKSGTEAMKQRKEYK